jgi:type IV secretion system protein VirB6
MACPAIITGNLFLTRVVAHIDCQAQLIGSYGYQALGQPGSLAATVATGLLTLFVALFGLRLLFGAAPGARDIVYDVLKVGLVLSLAFSWPAFRTLIYDVVVDGPAEVASAITGPTSSSGKGLVQRLQEVDNGIVRLIDVGTGRQSGASLEGSGPGSTFAGTALQDDNAFGWSRLLFLGSTIGTVGLLRLMAGLLLAIAPLMAGLLLFEATRGLFAGWLRGLVLTMLGSLGATVVLGVQLAIVEPWLADALTVRNLGYAAPATPIELFAVTLAFGMVQFAMIALLARVAFHRGWPTIPQVLVSPHAEQLPLLQREETTPPEDYALARARRVSGSVELQMRREEQSDVRRLTWTGEDRRAEQPAATSAGDSPGARPASGPDRLGDSWRRSSQRGSVAARNRDIQS